MNNNKSYEEKIADIKKYLKEKEEEFSQNRVNKQRNNPINKSFNDDLIFDEKEDYFNKINKNNSKNSSDENNTIMNKIEINNEYQNEIDEDNNNKKNKINIFLIILLIISPIFIFLSVISFNTTYLVREPFNYCLYALSGISIIAIISLLLLKCLNKNKKEKKLKYIVTILIISILDIIFMFLCMKGKLWTHIDPILEHKKLFVLIILSIILLFIIILIIRKVKHKKLNRKIRKFILTIFMTLYVLCYFNILFVLYGPYKEFKEWFITTAMQTLNHQYFCKWFYSEKDINYILSQNYVQESGESTNPDLVNTEKEEVIVYENEYEEAILKKEHKDDLYKIIELEVNGCKGYLAAIYDPTTVHVAVTKNLGVSGQYVTTMAKDRGAVVAINGGGFYDPNYSSAGGTPMGITIVNGEIKTNNEYGTNVQGGGIIGFDEKGVLYLLKNTTAKQALDMGIIDAVSWGPFLIVNGEPSFIKGNGGWGYAARTAIGQRADGIVLLLAIDSNASRTKGADMVDLTEIMQNYGAINAANLDGGTSTVMVMPKEQALKYNNNCTDDYCTINDPIDGGLRHQTRAISDAIVVVPK